MGPETENKHDKHQDLAPVEKQAEEFEDKLREANMSLFRQFRLKDFMVRAPDADIHG